MKNVSYFLFSIFVFLSFSTSIFAADYTCSYTIYTPVYNNSGNLIVSSLSYNSLDIKFVIGDTLNVYVGGTNYAGYNYFTHSDVKYYFPQWNDISTEIVGLLLDRNSFFGLSTFSCPTELYYYYTYSESEGYFLTLSDNKVFDGYYLDDSYSYTCELYEPEFNSSNTTTCTSSAKAVLSVESSSSDVDVDDGTDEDSSITYTTCETYSFSTGTANNYVDYDYSLVISSEGKVMFVSGNDVKVVEDLTAYSCSKIDTTAVIGYYNSSGMSGFAISSDYFTEGFNQYDSKAIPNSDSSIYDSNNYEVNNDTSVLFGTIDCEGDGILGDPDNPGDTAYYLQLALEIMRYVAIVALIGLSIVDYAKAVTQSDADALKKANQTVIKRLIYTVLLFLFPIILGVIFDITGIYGTVDPFCGLS